MPNSNTEVREQLLFNSAFNEEYYNADLYVKMAHRTTARSYWAFSTMIVISTITIIVLFNEYLSYDISFFKSANLALRENVYDSSIPIKDLRRIYGDSVLLQKQIDLNRKSITIKQYQTAWGSDIESIPFKKQNIISQDLRENMIRNYADSRYINIPLIGAKISPNDILILMGFAFFVISFWFFLCIRSENFTVGKILTLTQEKKIDIQRYIFYGICFNNMFFPTTQRSKPYTELSNPNRTLKEELEEIPVKMASKSKKKLNISFFLDKAFFIPTIMVAICYIIHLVDIAYMSCAEKTDLDPNWSIYDLKIHRFDFLQNPPYNYSDPYFVGALIGAAIFLIGVGYFNKLSFNYQKGTNEMLHIFKRKFKHESDCYKTIEFNKLHKKMTVITVGISEDILFNDKEIIDAFSNEYSVGKGYFLLTHSGNTKEVHRLWNWLSDIKYKDCWPKGFSQATIDENFKCFPTKIDPQNDVEYFIFLKENITETKKYHSN